MTNVCIKLVWLLTLLPASLALETTTITGKLKRIDENPVNSTKIVLNGGEFTSYSKPDGSFAFYHVPPGVHVLDVISHSLHFGQIKIQLLEDAMYAPNCIEYAYPGAPKQVVPHPLVLKAHAAHEYFETRPGFSIFNILQNPMILLMLFSFGLMFLMPKMMEGLEPEDRERMRKQMEMQKDPSKMFASMFGMAEEEESKTKRRVKRD
jgi:hypothetical protein